MKNIVFFFLLSLLFFQSCGHDSHVEGTINLQLDNGKRWKANTETIQGIAGMLVVLTKYESNLAEEGSRKALQQELEAGFEEIFKKCTMTGKGHEQLHHYLLPMKELFEKIGSGTQAESELAAGELKEHLTKFHQFFE